MNMFDEIDVGVNIKKIRTEKGLTQTELGKKISKSESTIRKYESGSVKVTMEMLKKISEVLDTPIGKFLETLPTDINDINRWDKEITPQLYLSKISTDQLIEELNRRSDFPIKIEMK